MHLVPTYWSASDSGIPLVSGDAAAHWSLVDDAALGVLAAGPVAGYLAGSVDARLRRWTFAVALAQFCTHKQKKHS